MFRGEYGICKVCAELSEELGTTPQKKLIVIKKPYLCKYHNDIRKSGGQVKIKEITKSSIKPKFKKATGEWDMFMEIWDEKPHNCENCRCNLGDKPEAFMFSHIITKGSNSSLRLVKDNIEVLCYSCHQKWEFGDLDTKRSFKASKTKRNLLKKHNYILYEKLYDTTNK